jgi:hypothetical protein
LHSINLLHQLIFQIDQQNTESEETQKSPATSKPQKHVTFSEENQTHEAIQQQGEIIRNFYMMDSQEGQPQPQPSEEQQPKPNFLVGGDIDEIEEKDEFPPRELNGSIPKTFSDATLIDKRRRLR